jgi:hypothetical protein
MQGLTEDEYLFEERAGIIEFDGNVPRHIAEQEARRQLAEAKKEQREMFGGRL